MKKIIAAFLLCIMLLGMIATPALADESSNTIVTFVDECIIDVNHVIYTPVLQYHETEEGNFITATYMPDFITELLLQKSIREKYNIADNWTPSILVDYKWNDDEWVSQKTEIDVFSNDFANRYFEYDAPITKPVTMILFDLRKYHPELDTEDAYADIIYEKDGKWAIDFSKTSLSVRFEGRFLSNKNMVSFFSEASTLKARTPDTLDEKIPAPMLGAPMYNHTQSKVFWQILSTDEMRYRTQIGEKFHTVLRYQYQYEDGSATDWSTPISAPLREHEMMSAQLDKYTSEKQPLLFVLQVAYVNSETNAQSDWTEIALRIREQNPPTYDVIPDVPTGPNAPESKPEPESSISPEDNTGEGRKYYKCGVCKSCSIQPCGICLWMFLGICVSVTLVSFFATLVIADIIKKRKQNKS